MVSGCTRFPQQYNRNIPLRFKHTPKRKSRILAPIDFCPKKNQHRFHSMYTSPPLLRQSFVPWKGWEAQCPSPLAQCSSVQSGDAARGVSSTSLQDFYSRVSSTSLARVSPLSVDLLCCTQQPRKKGWRSLPDIGERLPPAPPAIPRLYNALRNAPFSFWWSGGWANRATALDPSAKSSSSKSAFSTVPEMRHPYVSVDQLQNFTEGGKRDVKTPLCESPRGVITLLQHHGPRPNNH